MDSPEANPELDRFLDYCDYACLARLKGKILGVETETVAAQFSGLIYTCVKHPEWAAFWVRQLEIDGHIRESSLEDYSRGIIERLPAEILQ